MKANDPLFPEHLLLNVNEVALLFRVHPKTIIRWVEALKLIAIQVGKRYYFNRDYILGLLGR